MNTLDESPLMSTLDESPLMNRLTTYLVPLVSRSARCVHLRLLSSRSLPVSHRHTDLPPLCLPLSRRHTNCPLSLTDYPPSRSYLGRSPPSVTSSACAEATDIIEPPGSPPLPSPAAGLGRALTLTLPPLSCSWLLTLTSASPLP